MNNFKDADALLRIIDERVAAAVNAENRLTVTLMRDSSQTPMTVTNKTGETCAAGDVVYVEEINGVMVNATLRCGN